MDNEIKIENLAGMILDKHFPHSYYSPVVSWELGHLRSVKSTTMNVNAVNITTK